MKTEFKLIDKDTKQKTTDTRNTMEAIRHRAQFLSEPDRTLISMYIDNTNSYRQIAKLAGVNEVTVARRIKKILKRLSNNSYDIISLNCERLSKLEQQLAREYFIKGIPLRLIAKKHKLSYYKTRQIISFIKRMTNNKKYHTTVRSY